VSLTPAYGYFYLAYDGLAGNAESGAVHHVLADTAIHRFRLGPKHRTRNAELSEDAGVVLESAVGSSMSDQGELLLVRDGKVYVVEGL